MSIKSRAKRIYKRDWRGRFAKGSAAKSTAKKRSSKRAGKKKQKTPWTKADKKRVMKSALRGGIYGVVADYHGYSPYIIGGLGRRNGIGLKRQRQRRAAAAKKRTAARRKR